MTGYGVWLKQLRFHDRFFPPADEHRVSGTPRGGLVCGPPSHSTRDLCVIYSVKISCQAIFEKKRAICEDRKGCKKGRFHREIEVSRAQFSATASSLAGSARSCARERIAGVGEHDDAHRRRAQGCSVALRQAFHHRLQVLDLRGKVVAYESLMKLFRMDRKSNEKPFIVFCKRPSMTDGPMLSGALQGKINAARKTNPRYGMTVAAVRLALRAGYNHCERGEALLSAMPLLQGDLRGKRQRRGAPGETRRSSRARAGIRAHRRRPPERDPTLSAKMKSNTCFAAEQNLPRRGKI